MHSVLKSYRASTSVYLAVSKFVVLLPDGRSDGGPRRRVRGDDTRSARDGNLAAGTSFYSTAAVVGNYGLPCPARCVRSQKEVSKG